MNAHLVKGDRVVVNNRDGKLLNAKVKHYTKNGEWVAVIAEDQKVYHRRPDSLKKIADAETDVQISMLPELVNSVPIVSTQKFDINERFKFMENMVKMVIKGTSVSMIITGEGGLGKTFTVLRQMDMKQLEIDDDYIVVKGFSTPRGLFRTLYENSTKLIIFDDCDEVLKNDIAKNLLKGALDSYDTRTINWIINKEMPDMPSSFTFEGRIIFISNMSQDRIDQAILSRCMSIDLSMSANDKISRMRTILPNIKPLVSLEIKQECLLLIEEYMEQCHDLNLRTLMKVIDIRTDTENSEIWNNMAIYAMTSTVS